MDTPAPMPPLYPEKTRESLAFGYHLAMHALKLAAALLVVHEDHAIEADGEDAALLAKLKWLLDQSMDDAAKEALTHTAPPRPPRCSGNISTYIN